MKGWTTENGGGKVKMDDTDSQNKETLQSGSACAAGTAKTREGTEYIKKI